MEHDTTNKFIIVHRDIKPSNIIIDQNDQIKLLDFGIAKDYNNDPNLTVVGQSVGGTPMYMSPEHISNAKITVQSDIYSLGVTFWHMLTGKAPYEGQSLAKIYSQIENEELEIIQKIYPYASKKVNDIIKKAKELNAVAIHPKFSILNKKAIDRMHSSGFLVYSWTINKPKDIKRAIQLGVDGIITDFPDRIKQ